MPARKRSTKKSDTGKSNRPSRPTWKGTIDFGLVTIPVNLYPAENPANLDLDMLDKRDFSRIHYKRVNDRGEEVPWDRIVKGYQYKKGDYVALTDEDFERANVEATHSITIVDFVDAAEISPVYYDKPYYLEPAKNGRRAYALLREAMRKTGKVGIAKVVIRSRQHLAALMVDGPRLVLNLLRFAHELRDPSGLDIPEDGAKGAAVTPQEIKMAERLLEAMVGKWTPEKYRDEYREDLLKLIDKKIQSGKTKSVEAVEPGERPKRTGRVIDIMDLLQKSVAQARKTEEPRRRKAS